MTTSDIPAVPRTIRVNDQLWNSFNDLVRALDPNSSASGRVRQMMQAMLEEYSVFTAPEHKSIDPEQHDISWYDCAEHGQPHRLLGKQPWGCSVANSRATRLSEPGPVTPVIGPQFSAADSR